MIQRRENMNFSKMDPVKLGIYIMDVQHPYLLKALVTFNLCTNKIAEIKGEHGSKILGDTLTRLGSLIERHLTWEETVFFPYLRSRIGHIEPSIQLDLPAVLKKIKSEHTSIARLIKKASLLSNNYTPSSDLSPLMKLCYAQLFDFEQDMLKHFFLEDNILFPKLFN